MCECGFYFYWTHDDYSLDLCCDDISLFDAEQLSVGAPRRGRLREVCKLGLNGNLIIYSTPVMISFGG